MHLSKKIFTASIFAAAAPAFAANGSVDFQKVESLAEANRVSAAVAGVLLFCGKEGLRKNLMDSVANELVTNGMEERKADFFETSVAVLEKLSIYSKGVAMGLTFAQVPPQRKETICLSAMSHTDKQLAGKLPQGEP